MNGGSESSRRYSEEPRETIRFTAASTQGQVTDLSVPVLGPAPVRGEPPGIDIIAAFSDRRFALVGFDEEESSSIFSALAALGSLAHKVDPRLDPLSGEMAYYGAVLLNLAPSVRESSWASLPKLLALTAPLIAVGTYGELSACPVIQRHASELLIRPLRPEELLVRIARCLGRSVTALDNSPSRKCRVLIADDDKAIFFLTSAILRGLGLECYQAKDGRQALAMARTILPDLLVLDLNMPFINGLDILSSLRSDPGTCSMKILLFTASDGEDIVKRVVGTELAPDDFLLKPFQRYQFLQRVRGLLPGLSSAAHTTVSGGISDG
jgi:DNA-binding response OmpR family regulator